jgi:hypothetical protein
MLRYRYIAYLVKNVIYVYSVSQTKPINAFFTQNIELLTDLFSRRQTARKL